MEGIVLVIHAKPFLYCVMMISLADSSILCPFALLSAERNGAKAPWFNCHIKFDIGNTQHDISSRIYHHDSDFFIHSSLNV